MKGLALISWTSMPKSNPRGHRYQRLLAVVLFVLAQLGAPTPGLAETQVKDHEKLLRESKDFRVRVQAALALGASGKKEAVGALCAGLEDENRTVRIASASGLGRLSQGGKSCLSRRLNVEKDDKVKDSIRRAMEQLEGGDDATPITSTTQYYVSLPKFSGPPRLNGKIRAVFVKAMKKSGKVAIAPAGEDESQAGQVLKANKKLKGFTLAMKATKTVTPDGDVEVKVLVSVLSYPGNDMVASYSKKVKLPEAKTVDEATEDDLILTAVDAAIATFIQSADTYE